MRRPPPPVGQHTEEVLLELGYDAEELEILRRSGAIGPNRARTGFDRKPLRPVSSYGHRVNAATQ